jgi:PhnB protein
MKEQREQQRPATLVPHLAVRDAGNAAEWYARALGARELGRIPVPDGRYLQIELRFGEATVMIADEFPEFGVVSPLALGGTYGALILKSTDAAALWEQALACGAEVFHPISDTFWGERHGQVIDPFGHRWGISQELRRVPPDELVHAAAEFFSATSASTA